MGELTTPPNFYPMKQVYINYEKNEIDFNHEFDLFEDGTSVLLARSNNKSWTEEARGEVAGIITNTGDGFIVSINGKKKISLDYAQANELFILLMQTQDDNQFEVRESKTIMTWPLSQ